MSFKDTWKPRVDGVDDADASAVNEIAEAVINNENDINKIPNNYYNKETANNIFANALKGNASGEVIRLDDVSPLAHMLGVKVRSNNEIPYVDIGNVKLSAQGKNLYNANRKLEALQSPFFAGDTSTALKYGYSFKLPVGKYTISAQRVRPTTIDGAPNRYIYFVKNTSGSFTHFGQNDQKRRYYNIEISENETLYIYNGLTGIIGNEENTKLALDEYDIQIEIGTAVTDYEPYIEPIEYTVNADGTVEGVKSIAPSTTLMTDTEGVIIECEYNKDANKVVKSLEDRISALETAIISQ